MKCIHCNKQISDDSVYCEHCGKKIEDEPKQQTKKNDPPKIFQDVKNHLEFIGYEFTEPQFEKNGLVQILGKHPSRSNLFISFFPTIGFTFVATYTLNKPSNETQKNKLLATINELNNQAIITSYGLTKSFDGVQCASWFPLIYKKSAFSQFIELFEDDIRRRLQSDAMKEYT
jgi:DNA-directed RNA polymerase subunit RPC12/RpoP